MKMPSKGPWFESGLKIIGPKKPKMKPIDPIIIPPIMICEAKLFDVFAVFFQTKVLTKRAITKEIKLGSKAIS